MPERRKHEYEDGSWSYYPLKRIKKGEEWVESFNKIPPIGSEISLQYWRDKPRYGRVEEIIPPNPYVFRLPTIRAALTGVFGFNRYIHTDIHSGIHPRTGQRYSAVFYRKKVDDLDPNDLEEAFV